nr:DUF4249 domain-containing protein [Maribellus maritimus]
MKYILIAGIVLLGVSCENIPDYDAGESLPVVEGYLFDNQPVKDIILKEFIPFESDGDEVFIPDAEVFLQTGEQQFILLPVEGKAGYYSYPGDDLQIITGETYKLVFNYNGEQVWGETTVPSAPKNSSLSDDEIAITQWKNLDDTPDFLNDISQILTLEWENSSSDYYYITVQNLEENPEPLELSDNLDFDFEYVSRPVQDNYFILRPLVHFINYGMHQITLYHVNKEYALMYESLNQDSRNLNEPYSNITNGVGIFSAFASKTIFFDVKKR